MPGPGVSLLLLLWPLALIQRPEAESPLWARRSLILLISGLSLRYLYWRCTASLNLDSSVSTGLSSLLLLAESWLLITGLLPLWLAWRRFPDRRREAQKRHRDWQASAWRPHVDILVPTYGEPLAVLQRSLLGCTQQSYPRTSVLVLDEATSALDTRTEETVMKAINSLSESLTVIMIAHRLSTVESCDRLIRLEQGIVSADGPPRLVLATQS